MRLVNICVSDRPGSDISAALCNCTQPAPCPLLQWFGQLVTVTVHECNWSITLHCTFTAHRPIEWGDVQIFSPLFIAQNNRMQQPYERLKWTFRSWNLCIFLTNVGQIFILVLFLTFTFILTHICQSTISRRMSWSNIFDFQQMCKEVARDGPCFYPGGLESLVRAISLFLSLFHFSQAGRKRGV